MQIYLFTFSDYEPLPVQHVLRRLLYAYSRVATLILWNLSFKLIENDSTPI